ncbi:MAG: dTDP-4-dehydrorhamnose 3,5-epimerase [Aquisalimonadaceae bacterium]
MPLHQQLGIAGAYVLTPEPVRDQRGWFTRYFCVDGFRETGRDVRFVQFNHSCTSRQGTIRGMHLQLGDAAEDKLVRCIRGRVLDVLVDLRRGSATLLRHVSVELSAADGRAVFIPRGVAHGFQSLCDNVELLYHHSNYYTPRSEAGLRYDDPAVEIRWPLTAVDVSPKDRAWPLLAYGFSGFDVTLPPGEDG